MIPCSPNMKMAFSKAYFVWSKISISAHFTVDPSSMLSTV